MVRVLNPKINNRPSDKNGGRFQNKSEIKCCDASRYNTSERLCFHLVFCWAYDQRSRFHQPKMACIDGRGVKRPAIRLHESFQKARRIHLTALCLSNRLPRILPADWLSQRFYPTLFNNPLKPTIIPKIQMETSIWHL